jgi:hypothetical protein
MTVLGAHQLWGWTSLQKVLKGHCEELVQTWRHAELWPEPSSMHAVPAAQGEPHGEFPAVLELLEHPLDGASATSAPNARKAATTRPKNREENGDAKRDASRGWNRASVPIGR